MECDPKKLCDLRRKKALNQEALAGASRLSVRTIQRAEKGKDISLQSAREISKVLEVEPEDFCANPHAVSNSKLTWQEVSLLENDPSGRHFFALRFARAFPGVRGITWYTDVNDIERRLARLLNPIPPSPHGSSWWLRGSSNMFIHNFRRTSGRVFLLNEKELHVAKIAAVHSHSEWRKLVYVECDGMPQTGLYEWGEEDIAHTMRTIGYRIEEYGEFSGKIVTRQELDDGAAVVEGELIDLPETVRLRARYITPYNFIIAANGHLANDYKNDEETEQVLDNILAGQNSIEDLASSVMRFRR